MVNEALINIFLLPTKCPEFLYISVKPTMLAARTGKWTVLTANWIFGQ